MKKIVYLVIFVLFEGMLLSSCKKEQTGLSVNDLRQMHSMVKELTNKPVIDSLMLELKYNRGMSEEENNAYSLFLENVNIFNQNGLDYLMQYRNLNPLIISISEDLINLQNQGFDETDMYIFLLNQYPQASEVDFRYAFLTYEIYNLTLDYFDENVSKSYNQDLNRDALGCALALAGTLVTTISAIWITGGAALVVWLISKGLATASIIASCTL